MSWYVCKLSIFTQIWIFMDIIGKRDNGYFDMNSDSNWIQIQIFMDIIGKWSNVFLYIVMDILIWIQIQIQIEFEFDFYEYNC